MTEQLNRIEAMLKELVHESRLKRVQAERDSYNENMSESFMSSEQRRECEKQHEKLCADIMEGNPVD